MKNDTSAISVHQLAHQRIYYSVREGQQDILKAKKELHCKHERLGFLLIEYTEKHPKLGMRAMLEIVLTLNSCLS